MDICQRDLIIIKPPVDCIRWKDRVVSRVVVWGRRLEERGMCGSKKLSLSSKGGGGLTRSLPVERPLEGELRNVVRQERERAQA